MRYVYIVLLLCACNAAPTAPAAPATSTSPATPAAAAASQSADTVVWIGIHARWNYAPGTEYDGNYDTTNHVFIVCNTDNSSVVPRAKVILESGGSCDTTVSNRVRLMEIKRHDTVATTIGRASAVNEGAVSFKTAQGVKAVQLREGEAVRLKQMREIKRP